MLSGRRRKKKSPTRGPEVKRHTVLAFFLHPASQNTPRAMFYRQVLHILFCLVYSIYGLILGTVHSILGHRARGNPAPATWSGSEVAPSSERAHTVIGRESGTEEPWRHPWPLQLNPLQAASGLCDIWASPCLTAGCVRLHLEHLLTQNNKRAFPQLDWP